MKSHVKIKYNRAIFVLLILCFCLGVGGCSVHHVNIRLPDQNASLKEKQAAYDSYRIDKIITVTTTTHTTKRAYGRPTTTDIKETSREHLILGNGDSVYDYRDLLKGVKPDSPTALAMKRSMQIAKRGTYIFAFGYLGSVALGAGLMGISFALPRGHSVSTPLLLAGAGTMTVGILTSSIWGLVLWFESGYQLHKSVHSYNNDLRDNLGLPAQ